MGVAAFTRARDRLVAVERAELPSSAACAEIVQAFHDVARFDWCAVMTTDPETFLPSGGVVEGFTPDNCAPFWDNELADPDFNKFADLARRYDAVATLVDAVDGDLARSPRYQKLYAPLRAADELRVAFVAGTSCLAVGAFLRPGDAGPFSEEELTDVRALLPLATKTVRRALGRRVSGNAGGQAPVVIMLDRDGTITGVSAGGAEVLDDLRVNVDGEFPGIIRVAAAKARWSRTSTTLTTQLQGRSGRWHRLHVAPMEGDAGGVVVTVEPARPDDLVRLRLDSYGLTPRETEIVLRLCRGLTTKEIGAELFISAHTVRDHVKAIYDKAGVTSRGELLAELFTTHVLGPLHHSIARVDEPVAT